MVDECICEYIDVLGPGYPLMRVEHPWCESCYGKNAGDPDPFNDPGLREDEPPIDM